MKIVYDLWKSVERKLRDIEKGLDAFQDWSSSGEG